MTGNVEVITNYDPETNEYTKGYFQSGVECAHIALEPQRKDDSDSGEIDPITELSSCSIILDDLKTIINWQKSLKDLAIKNGLLSQGCALVVDSKDNPELLLMKSLLVSSLVYYAKCVQPGRGKNISFEMRDFVKEDEVLSSIHRDVLNHRNNYAAHLGDKDIEPVEVFYVESVREGVVGYEIRPLIQSPIYLEFAQVSSEGFIKLVNHLIDKLNEKSNELIEQIMSNEQLIGEARRKLAESSKEKAQ